MTVFGHGFGEASPPVESPDREARAGRLGDGRRRADGGDERVGVEDLDAMSQRARPSSKALPAARPPSRPMPVLRDDGTPQVLLEVGELVQREVDLDELLDARHQRSPSALGADRGTLYLVDPERGRALLPRRRTCPSSSRSGSRWGRASPAPSRRRARRSTCRSAEGDAASSAGSIARPATARAASWRRRMRDRDGEVIGVVQVLNEQARQLRRRRRGVCSAPGRRGRCRASRTRALRAGAAPRRDGGARRGLPLRYRFNRIVGESAAMQRRLRADAEGRGHRRPPCSCAARAAPARSSSRAPCTSTARAATGRSSRSTARRSRRR